jgi:hypothetical protein
VVYKSFWFIFTVNILKMDEKINLILVDEKLSDMAKDKLSDFGEVIGFATSGLTYPAISGHPCIFLCQIPQLLIAAPNIPDTFFSILGQKKVNYRIGNLDVGVNGERKKISHSSIIHYNAAVNGEYLVHTLQHTDPVILQNCHYLKKIPVKQGYTRSSLLFLDTGHYITSDKGIDETLQNHGLSGLFVSPEGIVLPGFQNGFIGGAMGVCERKVFVNGSLIFFREGSKVRNYLESLNYEIVELIDGPLTDAGGILFM